MKAQAKLSIATRSGAAAGAFSSAASSVSSAASSSVSSNSVLMSWTKWRLLPSLLVAASCLAVPLANAAPAPALAEPGAVAAVASDAICVELLAVRPVETPSRASAGVL